MEICDYCEKEAKYYQELIATDMRTGKKTIAWVRVACEEHKDDIPDD